MKNLFLFMVLAAAGALLYLAFAADLAEKPDLEYRERRTPQDTVKRVLKSNRSVGDNTSNALEAVRIGKN